jgi:hypothetical protein
MDQPAHWSRLTDKDRACLERDVTRKWGLALERGGKAVNMRITIGNMTIANARMALLLGSSYEFSGEVEGHVGTEKWDMS